MDNLVRDSAMTKAYLQKINDIRNEIVTIEDNLRNRPTHDELERKFEKLSNYVSIKAFQGLQRIVSQKAESITADEMKITA